MHKWHQQRGGGRGYPNSDNRRGRLRDLYTINSDRGRGGQKSRKLGWRHLYTAPSTLICKSGRGTWLMNNCFTSMLPKSWRRWPLGWARKRNFGVCHHLKSQGVKDVGKLWFCWSNGFCRKLKLEPCHTWMLAMMETPEVRANWDRGIHRIPKSDLGISRNTNWILSNIQHQLSFGRAEPSLGRG